MNTTEVLLNRMIRHAYDTVPYYNNVMNDRDIDPDSIKTLRDLSALPTLRKKDIVEIGYENFYSQAYDFINIGNGQFSVETTSGTTGEPLRILWLKKDLVSSLFHHWKYRHDHFNIDASSRFCSTYRNRGSSEATIMIRNHKREMSFNKKYFDDEILGIYYEQMKIFEPEWLYIQPSILYIFLGYLKENNLALPPSVRFIELIGEHLFGHYRQAIRETFHVPFTNMYGCEETKGIAYECEKGHFHLLPNNVVVEILKDGEQAGYGVEGDLHVTGLCNTAMPFIRYCLGDRAVLYPAEYCGCGNRNPVLELCAGRVGEFLFTGGGGNYKAGNLIFPTENLDCGFADHKTRAYFQLGKIQNNCYNVRFHLDGEKSLEPVKACFLREVGKLGLQNITWNVGLVDEKRPDQLTGMLILDDKAKG